MVSNSILLPEFVLYVLTLAFMFYLTIPFHHSSHNGSGETNDGNNGK